MAEESSIAVCDTCGMPVRVVFENGEIVKVFAVCGHVTLPDLRHTPTGPASEQGEACRRCGSHNPPWSAASPLWNAVMRGGSIAGKDDRGGIVCATCFMVLAEERGIANLFRVTAEVVNVELETVTPDGRVWDEQRFLWVEPAPDNPEQEGDMPYMRPASEGRKPDITAQGDGERPTSVQLARQALAYGDDWLAEGIRRLASALDEERRRAERAEARIAGLVDRQSEAEFRAEDAEQERDEAVEALREVADNCPRCHGRGRFYPECWKCRDSTHDHDDCPPERDCEVCAPTRATLDRLSPPEEGND